MIPCRQNELSHHFSVNELSFDQQSLRGSVFEASIKQTWFDDQVKVKFLSF